MKKLSLLLLAVALFLACKKEEGSGKRLVELSSFIKSNYTDDAHRLLLRRIINGDAVAGKDKFEFDTTELNRILNAIQAVYNLDTKQTDSIFSIVKVHTFPNPSLKYISIHADTGTAEGRQIIKHQPSGNTTYDQLISRYGFNYHLVTGVSNYGFAELESAKPYNLAAFAASVKALPFIINAQLEGSFGDGNNIIYNSADAESSLDFSIGTGDCPAGCGIRHGWKYQITNGKAVLIRKY